MPDADHNCDICGKPCDCMDFMFDESDRAEAGDPYAVYYGDEISTKIYDCSHCLDYDE